MFGSIAGMALALTSVESSSSEQDIPLKHSLRPTNTELGLITPAQWADRCEPWDDWDKPVQPFKIAADLYYIGTCGITILLVTTKDGNVLIDTGTETGIVHAYRNIVRMRENPAAIGLILYSHEHFDHVGGMAFAQGFSQAPVVAAAGTGEVFRTGKDNPRDPQAGVHEPMKPAPNVIEIDTDRPVTYGGIAFTPISTPGHTPGALSWQWNSCAGDICNTIVYADSLSPVSGDGYKFSDHREYLAEYRAGIERLRGMKCDILLTPHPSHSKMIERAATGTLEGGMSCAEYADSKTKALDERLAREAAGQ